MSFVSPEMDLFIIIKIEANTNIFQLEILFHAKAIQTKFAHTNSQER
jgi:hypothetical protein